MLVFLSDTHLTDGTAGQTINSSAFRKFTQELTNMVISAQPKTLEVVFLGDIFDIIRSSQWLKTNIRPWSDPADRDEQGSTLEDRTFSIASAICAHPDNIQSMTYLNQFKNSFADKLDSVQFTYIPGNHDWLINRFASSRELIANFLGLENPSQYKTTRLQIEKFWDDHKTFALHGDVYDPFNYDGDRDESSLGDAIVIELINKFAAEVNIQHGTSHPNLVKELKEIDNIRPLVDIPQWIDGACRKDNSDGIDKKIKEIWNDLANDFLKLEFVRQHDKPWRMDIVDALQIGLKISTHVSFQEISRFPLKYFASGDDNYPQRAYDEQMMRNNKAEFVLYGHTHKHLIRPLDRVPHNGDGDKDLQKYYFNTGTWKKIHVRTEFDKKNLEFLSWDVMTFVAIYLPDERKERRFEIWNGALS